MTYLNKVTGISLLSLGLTISSLVYAKRGPKGFVKAVMHTFYWEMKQLKGPLSSEEVFNSEEGQKVVKKSLAKLKKKFKSKPKRIDEVPGFSVTYEIIERHIAETQKIIEAGELDYARMKLGAMTHYCSSCHARLPQKSDSWTNFYKTDPFKYPKKPTFQDAEFFYIGRRYEKARKIYDELIRKYQKGSSTDTQLETAFERKLILFTRISRDPKEGSTSFAKDLENEKLPERLKKRVHATVAQLESLRLEAAQIEALTDQELIKKSEAILEKAYKTKELVMDSPNTAKLLLYSGALHERLFNVEGPELHPDFLFVLGRFEAELSKFSPFSISDVFFQQCVSKFPGSKRAPMCLKAYKSLMDTKFPARKPQVIEASIQALSEMIKKPTKSK